MASVNKQSLREEFETLKGRFSQLCSDGKITAEGRALFEALLMLLTMLIAVFMEKNTPKNSSNFSKPSSQIEQLLIVPAIHLDETSLRVDKKKGDPSDRVTFCCCVKDRHSRRVDTRDPERQRAPGC